MVTSEKQNAEMLQLLPCPFCGSQIEHVKSWAKSFQPNRLYHEWHHVADNIEICPVRRNIGKIVASATDDIEMRDDAISRWNNRAAAPSPHPRGEPVAWQAERYDGQWHLTDRRELADAWTNEEALYVTPLFAAPPPAGADAVREALEPFARISLWRDVYPDAKEDFLTARQLTGFINVADVRRARAVLALLPAPQPQEKPTGDRHDEDRS